MRSLNSSCGISRDKSAYLPILQLQVCRKGFNFNLHALNRFLSPFGERYSAWLDITMVFNRLLLSLRVLIKHLAFLVPSTPDGTGPSVIRKNFHNMKEIKSADDIRAMVDIFYERAGSDPLLAPIFLKIKDSAPYKEVLYRYWESQILKKGSDADQSFPEHISHMLTTKHFVRWLELFLQTIDSLYTGPGADSAKVILIRKSEEFQMKLELLRF